MTEQELNSIIVTIKNIPEEENALARQLLQATAESIVKDRASGAEQRKSDIEKSFRIFGEKEIMQMPKAFRKEFRTEGCTAHIRKRKSGKTHWNYEVRYRRHGYNITASANNLEEAKMKFLVKLKEAEKTRRKAPEKKPSSKKLGEFADYIFETYYKRKVTAETYKNTLNRYRNHIEPIFGQTAIEKIMPADCQALIDGIEEQGKGKTADEVCSILNMIFRLAVKHSILAHDPMELVIHKQHETQHGKALTKEEEKILLEASAGTPYQKMFAVALYTGMRPNEFETARIEGDFIVSVNSKRKNGKTEYKKIPIIAPLRPFLTEGEIKFYGTNRLRERFKLILPEHKIYDLRTTFYTRCCEFGVSDAARSEFVGHSLGALGNAYTDLSDEFLLNEGKKLDKWSFMPQIVPQNRE